MNVLRPRSCLVQPCEVITDHTLIAERYLDFLGDESMLRADSITALYLPTTPAEVSWAVQDISARGAACVVSAGRTGIAGGAVPVGTEAVISLGRMNRPLGFGRDGDGHYLRAEPGMTLASVTGLLRKNDFVRLAACTAEEETVVAEVMANGENQFWFPVNPTETSAHLGGIVATNASGARSYRYGATRQWVRALQVVLADGRLLKIRRGETAAENGLFRLEVEGGMVDIAIDEVALPATKATLGYPLRKNMDLIDLFIGSEGTLGVIVEVELRLAPRPPATVGVLAMTPDEQSALRLVLAAREQRSVEFDAVEYFDNAAFTLLNEKKQQDGAASQLPDLPNWEGCGIYFELSGTEAETEAGCETLENILQSVGLKIEDTWAAMEPGELAAQRLFRHAVPEAVNAIIGRRRAEYPGLHKVGTDMAVPDTQLVELMTMYRQDLACTTIDSVVFGHIGNNHLHVNLLPRNLAELQQAKEIYLRWARQVVVMGGAVAAEHGIGRLKKGMLEVQYPKATLEVMRRVRQAFDPKGVLAPGVLFDVLHT